MAVTITQQPQSPNAAFGSLVYVVSGSSSLTLPQYQFVIDVQDVNKNILSRLRQYPNPSGRGVIDVSNIVSDYLSVTPTFAVGPGFQSVGVRGDDTTNKVFRIAFGEEYGTSISSSVIIYNGKGSAGAPGVSGSNQIVFSAVNEPQVDKWDDLQFLTASRMSNNPLGLTESTAIPFDQEDFGSISFLNGVGNYGGGTQLVGNVVATVYNAAGGTLKTGTIGTGSGKVGYKVDIGVGPKNLEYLDSSWSSIMLGQWKNIKNWKVVVNYTIGGVAGAKTYWFERNACNYYTWNSEFNFVNRYGAWDFYKINYPFQQNTAVKRDTWTQPRVNYSTTTGQAGLDPFRRGTQQYYTTYEDTFSTTTPPLSESEADFLTQLMESQNVFWTVKQDYSEYKIPEPIIITNNNYTWWTNPRGQKLFQFTFEWKLANQRRPRT
jgi:hypothetical protein